MQKITLKPVPKELNFRSEEPNTYSDVFSYNGTSAQEKQMGSLFLLTHIKYDDTEDLSYILSLLSSLAKREYYSSESIKEHDPKLSFEKTLKKLNEVLEDFFETKKFKLSVGLIAISGENIYISKLGKFKVSLVRDGEHIDVLNNVTLFDKEENEEEQQFSNVISGALKPQDKILAHLPNRSTSLREKKLNTVLLGGDKDILVDELEKLSKSSNNFAFCGLYLSLDEVKEIPLEVKSSYKIIPNMPEEEEEQIPYRKAQQTPSYAGLATANIENESAEQNTETDKQDAEEDRKINIPVKEEDRPQAISAEFSIGSRPSIISKIGSRISQLSKIKKMDPKSQLRSFIVIAVIIIAPLLIFALVKDRTPNETKLAFANAKENILTAETLAKNNKTNEARTLLQASLLNILPFSDQKEGKMLKEEISSNLDVLDKVSAKKALPYYTNTDPNLSLSKIATSNNLPYALSKNGSVYSIDKNNAKLLKSFDKNPISDLFSTDTRISYMTDSGSFAVYNLSTKNSGVFNLDIIKGTNTSYSLYADNLYVVSDNSIYRYAEVNTGETKYTKWLNETETSTIKSIAVDGDIYALTTDGNINKYFKGKKDKTITTGIVPTNDAYIITKKDIEYIYLIEPSLKKIYLVSKSDGSLALTYKTDEIPLIDNVIVAMDGRIWILSGSNLYSIDP